MTSIERAVDKINRKIAEADRSTGRVIGSSKLEEVFVSTDSYSAKRSSTTDVEEALPEGNVVQVKNEFAEQFAEQSDKHPSAPISKVDLVIPASRFRKLGMVSPNRPRSEIAEEYRSIKIPLLRSLERGGHSNGKNVLVVTSSIAGEGKTFSALNLSLSISMERDKTVLLVDTDLAKASAGSLLNLPRDTPGLTDLLLDPTRDVSEFLLQTDIPNLRFLPAGTTNDHSVELLASDSMKVLVNEMSVRYSDRVVIFDAPPILLTNEASILTDLADQVVFVVAAESTGQELVSDSLSHLNREKPIGLILNKSTKNSSSNYGYRYGHLPTHNEAESEV